MPYPIKVLNEKTRNSKVSNTSVPSIFIFTNIQYDLFIDR